jgi:hypothetical protein
MTAILEKVYIVKVFVYTTEIVPKYTKYYSNLEAATQYKEFLETEVLWNTEIKISIEDGYVVKDGVHAFLLNGQFVNIS